METASVNRKVNESIGWFESLPEIQPSLGFNEQLNARLRNSGRKRKALPVLAIAVVLLVLINTGALIKALTLNNDSATKSGQKLEVLAENILINPDSANN